MSESECENCRFWKPHHKFPEDAGHCHRMPPQIVPLTMRQLGYDAEDVFKVWDASIHPITWNYDWCGEYQPKQDSEQPEDLPGL